MLSHHHRRSTRTKQAGQVGEWMGMVDVDDIGALPGGRDVSGRDFLAAKRRERKGPGHARAVSSRLAGPAATLDRHHLDLVAEVGGAFRQRLDHPLHAAGPRPVVLREVQDAHGSE